MFLPNEESRTRPSLSLSEGSRILALDWGEKRVGLALSDPLGIIAQGLPTMSRRNKEKDLNFLKSLVRKHQVSLILMGNPLRMDGAMGAQAEKIGKMAEEIREYLKIEVRLWDERLTSVEAHRVLSDAGVIPSRQRESVDRMAAILLLQNFLDSQARPALSMPDAEDYS